MLKKESRSEPPPKTRNYVQAYRFNTVNDGGKGLNKVRNFYRDIGAPYYIIIQVKQTYYQTHLRRPLCRPETKPNGIFSVTTPSFKFRDSCWKTS